MTEDDCRKKWKYLRDRYIKEKRKEKDAMRSGAGASWKSRWKFVTILGFLEPHIKERQTSSNFQMPDDSEVALI